MFRGHLKLVLLKVLSLEPSSGYALMKKLEQMLGAKPSPGSIYPLLDELAAHGRITCKEEGRRKIYSITKEGRMVLQKLEKHKADVLTKMQDSLKMWGMLSGEDTSMHQDMLRRMEHDELPFGDLSKEACTFKELLGRACLLQDKERRKKVRKIVQATNKAIRMVLT